MSEVTWRPASEAEAVSTPAVFLEWLRAVHGVVLDGPAALVAWRRDAPAAFAAAISGFAGLAAGASVRAALLHGQGKRPALVVLTAAGAQTWSRAALLATRALPEPLDKMLAALRPSDLPALAASHLLDADTRPDSRLLWVGDPAEPWPLGAWLVGATVLLAASGEAIPPAETTVVPAAPAGWRG